MYLLSGICKFTFSEIKKKNVNEIKEFLSTSEKIFDDVKVNFEIKWLDFKELFDKKNIKRKECLLLPLKTVSKALKF